MTALRAKVRVEDDPAMALGTAKVTLELDDGVQRTVQVAHARGSLEHPLTDAELERKLATLAAHGCPDLDVGPLVDAVWSIEHFTDVQEVVRRAVPDAVR